MSSQLVYTTSTGSLPGRDEFRTAVALASSRRHCAQPPPPFQPLPALVRGRTQLDRSVGENRSYVLGLVQPPPPPPPPIVVVVNVDNDDQPRRRCSSSSGRGDGFITVRAGIAAWSETAACPRFEVSSSIPASKAFLSDDVEICEID